MKRRIVEFCAKETYLSCVLCTSGQWWQGEEKVLSLTSCNCIPSFLPSLKKMDLPNFMTLTREVALNVKVGTFRVHFHTWDFKTKRRNRRQKGHRQKGTKRTPTRPTRRSRQAHRPNVEYEEAVQEKAEAVTRHHDRFELTSQQFLWWWGFISDG